MIKCTSAILLVFCVLFEIRSSAQNLVQTAVTKSWPTPLSHYKVYFDTTGYQCRYDEATRKIFVEKLLKHINISAAALNTILKNIDPFWNSKLLKTYYQKQGKIRVLTDREFQAQALYNMEKVDSLRYFPFESYTVFMVERPVFINDYALIEITAFVKSFRTHTKVLLFKRVKGKWEYVDLIYSSAS